MNRVHFGNAQELLTKLLTNYANSNIVILVDENTKEHCLPKIIDSVGTNRLIQIKSGEENKILDTCNSIWTSLTSFGIERSDIMINLGGGVIGDMGGFCAATYKRGIDFINIPTTLLSQVDASIGGKLGIDFQGYKNQLGLFKNPSEIIIDPTFLETLPERELKSGFAEMIKHSLIESRDMWSVISALEWPLKELGDLIKKSIEVKRKIVESDFNEKGLRKTLNIGHTIGHALESYLLNTPRKILHGEAVAAGLIMETWLSVKTTGLDSEDLTHITKYITSIYGKVQFDELDSINIQKLMKMDKKNKGDRIMFSLLKDIGSAVYDINVSEELVSKSLSYYRSI